MSFPALSDTLPPPAEPTVPPRRKGTLLIVDDEDGPRQSLRVIFKDDYEILMANDGPSAIMLAQNQKIDVAVLDIRMAGMSGIEVLERLKYVDPTIEVVMMTAFETTDTIRQALRLRACDYINKPFDISTMRAAVAGAMHRRASSGRHGHVDVIPQVRPVAEYLQLLDIASSLEAHVLHAGEGGGKLPLAEWLLSRNHEDHVVRHQAQDGIDITLPGRRQPRVHQVANGAFIVSHRSLRSGTPAGRVVITPESSNCAQVGVFFPY